MPVSFETGTLLEVRGGRWLLTGVAAHGSCTVLTLAGRDRENDRQQLCVIDPFDRSRRASSTKPRRRPRRAVIRAALGAIVEARPASGLWTAARASIDLWPYQLEPALAVVNGATRLLLADAVGLGKTIQAGLLLSELRERGWIEHALIVCPAGLRDTWARELSARFGIRAAVLDQAALLERATTLPPGVNPWAGHAVAIASIDLVKRAEVLAAIDSEPIDLLIADEAHHLTPGTDRGAAMSRLASRATWCALLSATPHSGDDAAFDYLTNIGARGDALSIFRRSRRDVGHTGVRRSHVLAVTPTSDEAALFAAIDRYTRAIWRERGRDDPAARLVAVTLARRAASSSRAITRTLARRLELLGTAVAAPAQALLPWDDDDDADEVESNSLLSTAGLQSSGEERSCLEGLIRLSRRCESHSKLLRLTRLIERCREPVLIFTEYRDSLEAVLEAVRCSRPAAAIHGGVPGDERRAAVDAFNDGLVDVLVATDAAGEGLSLHHRCRLVIDLELPWNPLRLEQRVGRIDRIGQQRIVHAIRMIHPHSIEQHVLGHLRLRDRRAADALDRQITESMVAGAVFGGVSIDATAPVSIASAQIATASDEATRIQQQRRARAAGALGANGLLWTAPRNGRHANLVVLTRRSYINDSGAWLCDAIEARVLFLGPVANRREFRRLVESERHCAMEAPSGETVAALTAGLNASRAAIHDRIAAIRASIAHRVEEQASLFDRRAEEASVARRDAARRLDQALSRTLRALASPSPERTRVELIAAWPWPLR